jgi:hypothetical protein
MEFSFLVLEERERDERKIKEEIEYRRNKGNKE